MICLSYKTYHGVWKIKKYDTCIIIYITLFYIFISLLFYLLYFKIFFLFLSVSCKILLYNYNFWKTNHNCFTLRVCLFMSEPYAEATSSNFRQRKSLMQSSTPKTLLLVENRCINVSPSESRCLLHRVCLWNISMNMEPFV